MSTMSMSLDCEQFSERLADYLEGELPDASRAAMESHAHLCASCGALLADLASLRVEAAALPALQPSRDLWAGIAERIDAPVLPLELPAARGPFARRSWVRPAVAAAALVLVTAGITHVLTRVSYDPTLTVARGGAASPAPRADSPAAPLSRGTNGEIMSTGSERSAAPAARGGGVLVANTRSGAATGRTTNAGTLMKKDADPVYDQEIIKLRRIVKERRSDLDPRTISVLEQSIAVIDSAIAQSRAALAKDPASGFLATQLNHSLEKKVELLRTAALLPART
jgi:hypothetical protein